MQVWVAKSWSAAGEAVPAALLVLALFAGLAQRAPAQLLDGIVAHPNADGSVVLVGSAIDTGQLWWDRQLPATNVLPGRMWQAMAYDAYRDRVVLHGGGDASTVFGDTWEWDSTRWARVSTGGPSARYDHSMSYDAQRRRMVLFGGRLGSGFGNDTWEWDGNAWSLVTANPAPAPRAGHAMAYDPDRGRIVLFGGLNSAAALDDTWEYGGGIWTMVSNVGPSARWDHTLAFDAERHVIVLHGGTTGDDTLSDTWEWDGTAWTQRAPMLSPAARAYHALAYDSAHDSVVLFGGQNTVGVRSDTWEISGGGHVWSERHPALSPSARSGVALAYDSARARAVLFGGWSGSSRLSDTWQWDGDNWTQAAPPNSPPARSNHALVYDPARGVVVLFGGYGASSPYFLADTWEWDGSTWTQRTPTNAPPARSDHALAYDAVRGRVLLFGGHGSSGPLSDTWEWDGITWTQRSPVTSPPARFGHALAYDSAGGRVVLFGGGDISTTFSDTWEWNGNDWMQLRPATGPTARLNHGITYDAVRRRVVLFGGEDNGALASDTWLLDGSTWTKAGANAPARRSHAMEYDTRLKRIVMFGGISSAGVHADAWTWDGSQWRDVTPSGGPSPRQFHATACDSLRGRIILFGGWEAGAGTFDDTWLWDGASWQSALPSWTGWASMPVVPEPIHGPGLDIGRNADGRLQVFYVGATTGHMLTVSQQSANSTWGAWTDLGAPSNVTLNPTVRPRVATNADGRLEVFSEGIGTDLRIWHKWQISVNGSWSSWQQFPGQIPTSGFASMTTALDAGGHLNLFAEEREVGGIWHSQQQSNGAWTNWTGLGGGFKEPVAVSANNAVLHLLATSRSDGTLYHSYAIGGGWSAWSSLGRPIHPVLSDPMPLRSFTAEAGEGGGVEVFATGVLRETLWRQSRNSNGTWSGWQACPSPSLYGVRDFAIGRQFDGKLGAYTIDDIGNVSRVVPDARNKWGSWQRMSLPPLFRRGAYLLRGIGCNGSSGVPEHGAYTPVGTWPQPDYQELPYPVIGETSMYTLGNPYASSIAVLLLGMSSTNWGVSQLPLDLSALGAPGCNLYNSIDFSLGPAIIQPEFSFVPVHYPNDRIFIGHSIFTQYAIFDAQANPLGVILSNSIESVLGQAGLPDLLVSRITHDPYRMVECTIRNIGTRNSGAFVVTYYFRQQRVGTSGPITIPAGGEQQLTVPIFPVTGVVTVVADESNQILEPDKSNNSLSTLIIPTLPDLKAEVIAYEHNLREEYRFIVRNIGAAPTTNPFRIKGELFTPIWVTQPLAPGELRQVAFARVTTWLGQPAPRGWMWVDVGDHVLELNESNNCAWGR